MRFGQVRAWHADAVLAAFIVVARRVALGVGVGREREFAGDPGDRRAVIEQIVEPLCVSIVFSIERFALVPLRSLLGYNKL